MEKTIYSPYTAALRRRIVGMRKAAGLNQRDLARRLRRWHSVVSQIEVGQRRVDLAEFFSLCRACGRDPAKAAAEVMREFLAIERTERRGKKKGF